jgi:hypothetical protein
MPAVDIIEFVLYITPGFIAIHMYRSRYPVRRESDFSDVCWSVVYGVAIFTVIRLIDARLLKNALHSDNVESPSTWFLIALLGAGALTGILRISVEWARVSIANIHSLLGGLAPDPQSVWMKVNLREPGEWVVVFLDDGTSYLGYISSYRFDPNQEEQDFLLAKAKRVDENLRVKYEVSGMGVYLNTRDVKRIEFIGTK